MLFPWNNTYVRLPQRFFARTNPVPVAEPCLIHLNESLATELGLDPDLLASPAGLAALSGNKLPENTEPISLAYAGHQFGHFVPQLGDGRAILLGEVIDRSGNRRDIQLKGAGRTPWSRGGDGRAALGPVLREYLLSEAMAALGIPTTRALAAVTTGETVFRETRLPGAIFTRVAASHVRVGTFQFFAARQDHEAVRALADYVIARHYPACAEAPNPYLALLEMVIRRQAELIAQWMLVGFIHGVMNTDNMAISGETIDYGPCAFMDHYNPSQVYSYIDSQGRYSYANQPPIARWNLTRLAETLLPLLADTEPAAIEAAQALLAQFQPHFEAAWYAGLARKLGLLQKQPGDLELAQELLDLMTSHRLDFTGTFRSLCTESGPAELEAWLVRWCHRLTTEDTSPAERQATMRAANPAFIPRNHLVEEVIDAAVNSGDLQPFEDLLAIVTRPYESQPGRERYTLPPEPSQVVRNTFCGT